VLEFLGIDANTHINDFKNELRGKELYYLLARGL